MTDPKDSSPARDEDEFSDDLVGEEVDYDLDAEAN